MEVFDETFVPPGVDTLLRRRCPACGVGPLRPVATRAGTRLLCDACVRCWRAGGSGLVPVDALTCPGCEARSRSRCIRAMRRRFPRFGPGP